MKLSKFNMASTTIVLMITTIAIALITGLWYAYSCSVNPGLGQLSDDRYIASMQAINRAILNPVFFATFIGTLALLPLCTWLCYDRLSIGQWSLMVIASIVYFVGVFGVTALGNVPLNEALDKFDLASASAPEISAQRMKFEIPWNRLHAVRTIASMISLVLTIVTCINYSAK
jgi:uncharacterized membrane protein